MSTENKKFNHLINETSPYLLQHAYNPVDWYAWGEEALALARTKNLPILLSVGYSACHWCHVMERESFENEEIAKLMNENFICIKVDREERPDLDQIYQNVAQLMTRSGGWPLTVFLTPELKPFFGGTYFPPDDRYGRPGFAKVLHSLGTAYREKSKDIESNAQSLTQAIYEITNRKSNTDESTVNPPTPELFFQIAEKYLATLDWQNGGFGGAPKFPHTMDLTFLWRMSTLTELKDTMKEIQKESAKSVILSLLKMRQGGIYDQLGGGFHRYSVDESWSVPHFEKMLYDNALLLKLYSEVLCTDFHNIISQDDKELFLDTLKQSLNYLKTEMIAQNGLFYTAQDADSPFKPGEHSEEGAYFVWSDSEINLLFPDPIDMKIFKLRFGVKEYGGFENGYNVLFLNMTESEISKTLSIEEKEVKQRLSKIISQALEYRAERIRPQTDTKLLSSLNALMITCLINMRFAFKDYRLHDESKLCLELAFSALQSLIEKVVFIDSKGFYRIFTNTNPTGKPLNGYLDDYAYTIQALLEVHKVNPLDLKLNSGKTVSAFDLAVKLTDSVKCYFSDGEHGLFFTSSDHEKLLIRPQNNYDHSIPSGVSVMIQNMIWISEISKSPDYMPKHLKAAETLLFNFIPTLKKSPYGLAETANAALLYERGIISMQSAHGTEIENFSFHPFLYHSTSSNLMSTNVGVICHKNVCYDYKIDKSEKYFFRKYLSFD